ncbi:MAG: hypothetical protein WAM39_11915, partial [Bryobacteraceae bacterium]
ISRSLNCGQPQPFEAQNISRERPRVEEVDTATIGLIRQVTEVDQRLYEFARNRDWKTRSAITNFA